jgi:hypothetical protein
VWPVRLPTLYNWFYQIFFSERRQDKEYNCSLIAFTFAESKKITIFGTLFEKPNRMHSVTLIVTVTVKLLRKHLFFSNLFWREKKTERLYSRYPQSLMAITIKKILSFFQNNKKNTKI